MRPIPRKRVEFDDRLLGLGAGKVVLKRGADGCSIYTASGAEHYPGFKANVVDTMGAGDSFDAAIVYGTLKGWPQDGVTALANAVGAVKVGKKAAGRNVPTLGEVKAFLDERNIPAGRLV
jgi:sugar/nucleoside kinase (ribokinase family)